MSSVYDYLECPYCHSKMRIGHIDSSHTIAWYPRGVEHDIPKFYVHKDGVAIKKFKIKGLFNYTETIAHYCEQCGKIIIDISENN